MNPWLHPPRICILMVWMTYTRTSRFTPHYCTKPKGFADLCNVTTWLIRPAAYEKNIDLYDYRTKSEP